MQYLTGIKSVIYCSVRNLFGKASRKKSGSNSSSNKEDLLGDFFPTSVDPLCHNSPSIIKGKRLRNANVWSGPGNQSRKEDSIVSTNSIQPLFQVRLHGHLVKKRIESEIPEVEEPLKSNTEWGLGKTTSEDLLKKEGNTRDSEKQIISHSSGGLGEGSGGGYSSGITSGVSKTETLSSFGILSPAKTKKRLVSSSLSILKGLSTLSSSPLLKRSGTIGIKMDHEDLISELPQIEKLSNQERLRLAHKRRMIQLKKFQQYDKEITSRKHKIAVNESRKSGGKGLSNGKSGGKRIRFRNSIMLLEAAGRNDVDEGMS